MKLPILQTSDALPFAYFSSPFIQILGAFGAAKPIFAAIDKTNQQLRPF
jgi:hypothetical protein